MQDEKLPIVEYSPVDRIPDSIAIYDREASLLVVNLDKPNDYSGEFIDSGIVSISLDSDMAIEDFELKFCTQDCTIDDSLVLPPERINAKVSFLSGHGSLELHEYLSTNNNRDLVHIWCKDVGDEDLLHLCVASGVVLDVTLENELVGIWVSNVKVR
jgi:hypothetical protein